ncbi:MAG: HD domain-containing protein [Nanoarchaeota archaeon]
MEEINKLRKLYKLKNVERMNSVGKRKESSAEHSWSCLILADYFLSKGNINVDRLKVYEMLIWHDIIEIEAGDSPLHPGCNHEGKAGKEMQAMKKIEKDMPVPLGKKAALLFKEFEECETMEARFAKAVDQLDAEIHEMDYKDDWKGWTKEFLIEKKGKYFEPFPELKESFEKILEDMEREGYFSQ